MKWPKRKHGKGGGWRKWVLRAVLKALGHEDGQLIPWPCRVLVYVLFPIRNAFRETRRVFDYPYMRYDLDGLKIPMVFVEMMRGCPLPGPWYRVVGRDDEGVMTLEVKYPPELSRMTVETIRMTIIKEELTPSVCRDSGQAEWSDGEARKLAEAIALQLNLAL